jgi:hypothetical protein
MVIIPKTSLEQKKVNPNRLNSDGSISVNNESFNVGDTFTHLCIRKPGTTWGKQFRNAKIVSIEPIDNEKTVVSIAGTSDWQPAETTCELKDII